MHTGGHTKEKKKTEKESHGRRNPRGKEKATNASFFTITLSSYMSPPLRRRLTDTWDEIVEKEKK